MTNPTPLSHAAQAVLNAFGNSLTTEQYATTGRIEIAIAAALRAVTDQAEIFFDAYDNPRRVVTVDDLLNIATELEALTND